MAHYRTIQDTRIRQLNDSDIRTHADYVLYWMQQSQRAEVNHALEYAVLQANQLGMGVVVGFGLTDDYPEANLRHYTFMLEGLTETRAALEKRGILMVVRRGSPPEVALALGQDAAMIVCDRPLNDSVQQTQFRWVQRRRPSRPASSCSMPRLPMKSPRSGVATISPVGITRFWRVTIGTRPHEPA